MDPISVIVVIILEGVWVGLVVVDAPGMEVLGITTVRFGPIEAPVVGSKPMGLVKLLKLITLELLVPVP